MISFRLEIPQDRTFRRNGRTARTHKQAMRPSRRNVGLFIFKVPIVLARCPSRHLTRPARHPRSHNRREEEGAPKRSLLSVFSFLFLQLLLCPELYRHHITVDFLAERTEGRLWWLLPHDGRYSCLAQAFRCCRPPLLPCLRDIVLFHDFANPFGE